MNEPKVRFKGFEGEWEEKKLGEVMDSYSGGTPSVGVKKYYDGDIPFIRSGEIHSDKTQLFITEEGLNNSSAKMVSKGTLLYALYGATSGDVAIAKIDGAINQAILAINPQPQYDSVFLENYLLKNKQSIIDTFLQGGQGNLSGQIVKDINLIHPSLPEQRRIASYFTHLDTLIEASRQKVEKLKQVKAASLQSFFPTHGERTPKIRFKGYEGEWKVVKIGEACFNKVSTFSESNLGVDCGKYPIYGATGYIQNIQSYDMKEPYVAIIKDGSGVGRVQLYPAYSSVLGTMQYLLPKENVDVSFLYSLFETIDFSEYKKGSSIPHIYFKDYARREVFFPPTLQEQRKIASYFTHLDTLLTLERQRYAKLQQVKRASLTQMFA